MTTAKDLFENARRHALSMQEIKMRAGENASLDYPNDERGTTYLFPDDSCLVTADEGSPHERIELTAADFYYL